MATRTRTRTSGIRRKRRTSGDVYEVRFRDAEGIQRSRTFASMDEARTFQNATLADVREGSYVAPTAGLVKFKVVAEEWFAGQAHLKRRTQITYRSAIDHNLASLHDRPVGRITYGEVQALVNAMTAAGRRPSTVRNVLMVCRLILDEAMRRKMIRTNPCRDVKPPRLRPRDNVFLTVEQVQALAEELPPPLDLLVLTAAGSGLRAGELNGLRVRDVELLRRRVNVRQTVADLGTELIVDTPKSAAGRRTVPLSPALCDLLAAHIGRAELDMDDLIFGDNGRPRRHNAFYTQVFQPAVIRAGLPAETRFHDLRHTYASLMIAAGVNPKRLSVWMGHTTVSLTMDRYGHLYDDEPAPAVLDTLCARPSRSLEPSTPAASVTPLPTQLRTAVPPG
ncbi:MAG TPA: site-specific integrase [Frankiaceae bacterium]|nr:site-specific integrase [Frankiaceae bacterium]